MTVYGGLQTGHREKSPGYITIDDDRLIDGILNIIELQGQMVDEFCDLIDIVKDAIAREKEEIGI